jgi:serine protease inhibitor
MNMMVILDKGPKPFVFNADHPFLIQHEPTGQILFIGHVADPAATFE